MTTWERDNESKRKKEPQIPRHFVLLANLIGWSGFYFDLNARLEIQILNRAYSGPLLLMSRVKDKCNLNSVGAIFRLFPRESKGSCKKSLLISVAFFDMHVRQGLGLRGFCFWKKPGLDSKLRICEDHTLIAIGVTPEVCEQKRAKSRCHYLLLHI